MRETSGEFVFRQQSQQWTYTRGVFNEGLPLHIWRILTWYDLLDLHHSLVWLVCNLNYILWFLCCRKHDWDILFWPSEPKLCWMQDLSETLNGIITSGRRSVRFSWFPALDFGFIVFYRDGRPGFRSSAAPSGRARRAGSQRRLEDHFCRAHGCAASRSLSAWEILPLTHTDASTFR